MKKFNLVANATISIYTTVEADSLEEAKRIAEDRNDMMSVHSNNCDSPNDVWMMEEIDGYPQNIVEE